MVARTNARDCAGDTKLKGYIMEITRAYAKRLVRAGKARFSGIDRTEAGSTSKDDGWIWGHIDRQDLNRVDCYRIERTID